MTSPLRGTVNVTRLDHSFILNLFTAVVVFSTFILVCHLVFLPSLYTKAIPRGQWSRDAPSGRGQHIVGKIPDFKQSRLPQLVRKNKLRPPFSQPSDAMAPFSKSISLSIPPSEPLPSGSLEGLSSPRPPPTTPPLIRLSSISKQQCEHEYCSEFLTSDDLSRWKECSQSAGVNGTQLQRGGEKCRFIDQPHRDAVALVSSAGSGNTWVRGLLEAATGICTGAVYCDISLRGKGFAGEYTRGGQALVIKTHSSASEWIDSKSRRKVLRENNGLFGSAILLIRNPFNALVAEWNRKVANNFRVRTTVLDSHTKAAGPEWFGK
jgi:hypothetical protein